MLYNRKNLFKIINYTSDTWGQSLSFILKGCIKLTKSNSEDIKNVTKVFYFKVLLFVTYSIIEDIISSEMQIHINPVHFSCHVTLKTAVMMLKIQLCTPEINYILQYLKNIFSIVIIFHIITVFTVILIK